MIWCLFMCIGDFLYEFLVMYVSVFKLDLLLLKIVLIVYGFLLMIFNVVSNELSGEFFGGLLGRDYIRSLYRVM